MTIKRFSSRDLVSVEEAYWNPQILYHYTTRTGFLGILTTGKVWATNIRYLNDSSEYIFALDSFKMKLEEIKERVDQEHKNILQDAIEKLDNLKPNYFVFCLSVSGDLLSQWRAYANPGEGYSIGFDAPELDEIISKKRNQSLMPICYSIKMMQEIFDDLEFKSVKEANAGRSDFGSVLANNFNTKWGAIFKDISFREENEWRIIYDGRALHPSRLKFRSGSSMLIPYIEIDIKKKGKFLPVKEIIIGPNKHPELEIESVTSLCKRLKIDPFIRISEIPYRN